MNYHEFLDTMPQLVRRYVPEEVEVHTTRVLKGSRTLLDGLLFTRKDSEIAPTVYLPGYYQAMEAGSSPEEIARRIAQAAACNPELPARLSGEAASLRAMQEGTVCRLISIDRNASLLAQVPHRKVLDLALICYMILCDTDNGHLTAIVRSHHLDAWGITEDELYDIAFRNTLAQMPPRIRPIQDAMLDAVSAAHRSCPGHIIREDNLLEQAYWPPEEESLLYVLSNRSGILGAVTMLYPGVLRQFAGQVEDDLIIFPSSVHEVLLQPAARSLPAPELNDMIRTINRMEVAREDRLSDHIYRYCRKDDMIVIPSAGSDSPETAHPASLAARSEQPPRP